MFKNVTSNGFFFPAKNDGPIKAGINKHYLLCVHCFTYMNSTPTIYSLSSWKAQSKFSLHLKNS